MLLGAWPRGEEVQTDAAFGRQVGGDIHVSSLRGAVKACLKAAHASVGDGAPNTANPAQPTNTE